jgi:hypothetical protein
MDGGKNPIHDGDYLLLERLSPGNAGSITGSVMAIERQDDSGDNQYLLRVVTKNRDGQYILKANNPDYEDLPATDDMRTLAKPKRHRTEQQARGSLRISLGHTTTEADVEAFIAAFPAAYTGAKKAGLPSG